MRSKYTLISKTPKSLLAVVTLVWTVTAALTPAQEGPGDTSELRNPIFSKEDASAAPADNRVLTLGPGRVCFRLSPGGEWLGLVPGWSDGKDVITGGGFVVLAVDESGDIVELVNTTAGDVRVKKDVAGIGAVHEGIEGGARYPLDNSDDDADGREDEDRLDGVDNDNDGRVDEDFAAVGDEMIVLGYEGRAHDGGPSLGIHQECYAWSLPHIDGMVAIKLVVKNEGGTPLRDVRVATLMERPGEFSVATQDLTSPGNLATGRMVAKGILMDEPGETTVAAVFFTVPGERVSETSWLTGTTGKGRHVADLLKMAVYSNVATAADDGTDLPQTQDDSEISEPAGRTGEEGADSVGRVIYGISPNLGTLQPGDEVAVYTALIAVPSIGRVDRAIEDAYRTVIGDGTHRMIPPPVSVTRRTVWGTYRQNSTKNPPYGVEIRLENLRGQGIDASDISFLTGIDLRNATAKEAFTGDVEIVLPGEPPEVLASAGGRVVLHGRLRGGEFFDVVLRPEEGERVTEQDVDQYWTMPGRLDEVYLTGSPNPFRESTTIFYEVPANVPDEEGGVLHFVNPIQTSVKVYNVAGRLVNILVDTFLSPGVYDTQWDGMDESGRGVASGVYYVKLQIGKKHVTKRLIQLK